MKTEGCGRRPRLSRQTERAIKALLENPSLEKAAAAAGISTATLWRWRQKAEFREAWLAARFEAYSQATARLQQGSSAAAMTLLRLMCDNAAPAASRVRAACSVLEFGARGIGLEEFEARLRELERASRREAPLAAAPRGQAA